MPHPPREPSAESKVNPTLRHTRRVQPAVVSLGVVHALWGIVSNLQWGTVPTWLALAGAGTGLCTYRESVKAKRREQAEKVDVWWDVPAGRLVVSNGSDTTIRHLWIDLRLFQSVRQRDDDWQENASPIFAYLETVPPNSTTQHDMQSTPGPGPLMFDRSGAGVMFRGLGNAGAGSAYQFWFVDGAGRSWQRLGRTRQLMELAAMPRTPWRGSPSRRGIMRSLTFRVSLIAATFVSPSRRDAQDRGPH